MGRAVAPAWVQEAGRKGFLEDEVSERMKGKSELSERKEGPCIPGQWEQQVQWETTLSDLGLPSGAPSRLVPDFSFPTRLLSAVYFYLS